MKDYCIFLFQWIPIQYFNYRYFFRLHDSSEKILDNPKGQDAKLRRKRRHRLRLFLLILDYIVESLGSIVIFIVVFVANKSILQQHALTTMGSFVYGVPIPFSYLLSETRIRVIIIENGWLQGIKAIFLSSGGIKQSKIDKIVECSHHEKQLISKFFNVSKKNTTNDHKKCLSLSDFESISKNDHIVQVHYNVKKGKIENKLISKSAPYNHAIHSSSSECSDISYNALHKTVDEIDLKPKDTTIHKSSSYHNAIDPSTSKCSDISDNSLCNNVDEIELKIERPEILKSASYYGAIHPSRIEDSDISYISERKITNNLHIKTLVVSDVKLDADVVISMAPEIDTFMNPMQPGIDTVNNLKVNRKRVISSRIHDGADVDRMKLPPSVDFQYNSMDAITVMGVESDVQGVEQLSSVGCRVDRVHDDADLDRMKLPQGVNIQYNSMDAITVMGVESDVQGVNNLNVNRKRDCSSHIHDDADVDTMKLPQCVNFQNNSMDAMGVMGVELDVQGVQQLSTVGCRVDSMQPDIHAATNLKVNRNNELFARIGVNLDVDTIKLLSSVDVQYGSIDAITVICVESDVESDVYTS